MKPLVTQIKDATLEAGRNLGGPAAWKDTREGYSFFQGPSATALIRTGAQTSLGGGPGPNAPAPGVAPIEGEEDN